MKNANAAGMALFTLLAGAVTAVAASFLPFFMGEVWGPLWGVEYWRAGAERSFGRVGPFAGVSPWAALLVVPLVAMVVMVAFAALVGVLVLSWRSSAARAR